MRECDLNNKLYVLIPTWDPTFLNKNFYKLAKKLSKHFSVNLLLDKIGSNPPFKYKVISFLKINSIYKLLKLTSYFAFISLFSKKKPVFFTYKGYDINFF